MNIISSIEKHANKNPDRTAIVFGDERIGYGALQSKINSLSAGLAQQGVKKGDRIALLMTNCPEMILSFYAAMRMGAISVSLNVMFQKDELDYLLGNAEPEMLITHRVFMPLVNTLERVRNRRVTVVQVEGDNYGSTPFSRLMRDSLDSAHAPLDLEPDTVAAIGYTSGTTGFPKGAVHTHENILYHLEHMSCHLSFGSEDTFLAALPFFQFTAFLIHVGMALYQGAKLVVMEKFEPVQFLDLVKKEKVSFFAAVPTIYQMLYDSTKDNHDALRRVRFGICAGAPLPKRLRQNFENQMKFRIIHCYGSMETPLISSFERPEKEPKGISVGKVSPHVRMRLVDTEGNVVKPGEPGEIQIRAERALKCYWNNPEATNEAIWDGWFSTGDIGQFDEDEHLHIVDRSKDMLIRGGFNIYPAEIERVLLQDPRILEAVVIGIPHDRLGEIPKAYIVKETGSDITEDDLVALSRKKLAKFKALEAVEFVTQDFFPRNALGKIHKDKIKRGKNEN